MKMDAMVRIRIPQDVKTALVARAERQTRRFQRRVTLSDVIRSIVIDNAAQNEFERAALTTTQL